MREFFAKMLRRSGASNTGTKLVDVLVSCALLVKGDGSVRRASPSSVALLRLPSNSPEGLKLGAIFPSHPNVEDVPIGVPVEVTALRVDGTRFPATVVRSQISNGLKDGHLVLITDEGARIEAERLAREASETLASVFEAVTDGMSVRDRDGRILAINAAAARMMRVTPDKLIGQLVKDALEASLASDILKRDAIVFETGKPLVYVRREEVAGRTIFQEVTRFPLIAEGGRVRGIIALARDITEAREAANVLALAKKQAECASAERARFLAAASHDLRQPIQAISLVTAALQREPMTPKGREALEQMSQGVEGLRNLIGGLLDIHQIEQGALRANREAFRLDGLLREVAASVRPNAEAKGLDFQVASTDAWILSDRVRLGQMLLNLVHNAVRYTDTGSVTIAVVSDASGHLRVEVKDTGIGIAGEHLSRIWDEFYQVGNPDRDRSRGLGLGLSIVARLSRLLDHRVAVDTAPRGGSTFSIEIPTAPAEDAGPVPDREAEVEPVSGLPLVLVIDDDRMVLVALESYLSATGFRVATAETEEAAIAAVDREGVPVAVVADYRLRGGRTGTSAVASVRRHVGRRLPGVVLTGEAESALSEEVGQHDLEILRKPVSGPALSVVLRRILCAANPESGA